MMLLLMCLCPCSSLLLLLSSDVSHAKRAQRQVVCLDQERSSKIKAMDFNRRPSQVIVDAHWVYPLSKKK
eukprot:m.105775 g.105775  ORF g.105775 m.105775 type:complete len:70 (-) comp15131_c0_seq1:486-695(-)